MKIECLSEVDWQRLKRIRLAALQDAPEAFGTTLAAAQGWPDDVWCQQARDIPTFVATDGGVDVGIARCATEGSTEDAYLISMWVAPVARGRGVGEQLVEAVSEWALAAGFSRLLLDVADDNTAAMALYKRLSFRPTGETSRFPPPRSQITEHQQARMLRAESK